MMLSPQSQSAKSAIVRVLSLPGFKPALDELGPQFERATGHTVVSRYGLEAQLEEALDVGEFDVRIVGPRSLDAEIERGLIVAGTRTDIARVGIGVAVKSGAPRPDISTVAAFKRALLDATSISYTRDSRAGQYLASLMDRLGIGDELRPKTKRLGGGGQNPRAVAAGEVELGLSVISDILPVAGAELLGPLPPELQHYLLMCGSVGATAKEPEVAAALLRFLAAPAAFAVIKATGMELPG
ncbi:MAG: ABC transporter substrate-binding protein [Betaproteobacteria bacterium]|nr:ABC transporter substrate-binding protein [Betaproteobacteria bacterium]